MKKNNIILAGSGYLGDTIIRLLSGINHCYLVTEISRSKKSRGAGIKSIQHDIDNSINLDLDLVDSKIIYMAPPDTTSAGDLRISKFIDTISKHKISRFIYISTSGVYGNCHGKRVNELVPLNPITDRAKRRVDAESKIIDFGRENNVEILILRVPGIYGKNRLPIKRVMNREPLIEKAQSRTTNLIHVEDLSRIVIRSLEIEIQEVEIINVSDGTAVKTTEYYEKIYDALEINLPRYVSYEEAKTMYDEKRLSFLNESRVLDTTKMEKIFPGCIKYTKLSEGIKASL
jgi:nucleoside-diphosphate-sugar epimerase